MSEVAKNPNPTILLDDVKLMWRNFAGEANQYNAQGQRNFVVFLPADVAEAMARDGFNIKTLQARDEGDIPQAFVKVNVRFESQRPPKIYLINSKGKRLLTPDMAEMADWATLRKADILINRYERKWPDGRTTVTPYLQTAFLHLQEDELEQRYADVPEIGFAGSQDNVLLWQESTPEELESIKILELES